MKRLRTMIIICVMMLLSAAVFSSISFAGSGSPESPSALIQGSSGGPKLFGTIMIEYFAYDPEHDCFASKVVLRLGRDSSLTTFSITDLCLETSPVAERNKILGELTGQILKYFFGPDSGFTKLTVVTFGEFVPPKAVVTDACEYPADMIYIPGSDNIPNPCHDEYIVADVTLSAN